MTQVYLDFNKNSPFQSYTIKRLPELDRECKVKYYYRLRKLDLVIALTTNPSISIHKYC